MRWVEGCEDNTASTEPPACRRQPLLQPQGLPLPYLAQLSKWLPSAPEARPSARLSLQLPGSCPKVAAGRLAAAQHRLRMRLGRH